MGELISVGIDELMADPTQPRQKFVKDAIERLSVSIKKQGVLQPLRIQRNEQRKMWLILTGESRWRAARLAGLTHVPCIAVEGELSEIDKLVERLTENSLREDLDPMDDAAGIVRLKALKRCNSKTLVEEYGFSSASITRAETLLGLEPEIQAMVGNGPGKVPPSTAYEIGRLQDPQGRLELAHAVATKKISRDAAAQIVRDREGTRNSSPKGSRYTKKIDGVAVTVTSSVPLTREALLKVSNHLRQEAAKRQAADATETILSSAKAEDAGQALAEATNLPVVNR